VQSKAKIKVNLDEAWRCKYKVFTFDGKFKEKEELHPVSTN
jgi:hypothetical protein